MVNVPLPPWELQQHALPCQPFSEVVFDGLPALSIQPHRPTWKGSSGAKPIEQWSTEKVKVVEEHINKICPLKWGIVIILMLRTKVAKRVGNTTVGD